MNWTFDNLNSKLQILRHCSSVVSFFYVENHLWQQIYHIHNIKSSHRLDKDRKRNIIYKRNLQRRKENAMKIQDKLNIWVKLTNVNPTEEQKSYTINMSGRLSDFDIKQMNDKIKEALKYDATEFRFELDTGYFTNNGTEYKIEYQKTVSNEEKLIITVKDEQSKDKNVKMLDIPKEKLK